MTKFGELLESIRAEIRAKRYRAIDLAREAGIPPTTLYSMLDENWHNQAILNAEAIAAAHARITAEAASPGDALTA